MREIRRNYRKLVLKWHPDKSDHPNATEKFKEIQAAYDILSNEEQKDLYDNFGAKVKERKKEGK